MRLDEELDTIPPHGLLTRLRSNLFGWLGHMQSAPALATLLVGVGFLAGNFTYRYQVAHQPRLPQTVVITNPANSAIANITGIVQTPNSEVVQVSYNRVVRRPSRARSTTSRFASFCFSAPRPPPPAQRTDSVALLANECRIGHQCADGPEGSGIRDGLLVTLRYDKSPSVRLAALNGLQPYVSQDQRVRDAVLECPNARPQRQRPHPRHQPAPAGPVRLQRPPGHAHRLHHGREPVHPHRQHPRAGGHGRHSVGDHGDPSNKRSAPMKKALSYGLALLTALCPASHTHGPGTPLDAALESDSGGVLFAVGAPTAHAAQGYLGVDVRDVTGDQLATLKLKEPHGAEIVQVDHDAPPARPACVNTTSSCASTASPSSAKTRSAACCASPPRARPSSSSSAATARDDRHRPDGQPRRGRAPGLGAASRRPRTAGSQPARPREPQQRPRIAIPSVWRMATASSAPS
jgi:hypothetical protein